MFSFFCKKKARSPLAEKDRVWLETSFKIIINGSEKERKSVLTRKLLLPNKEDFPIVYDGSDESATETLKLVARQIEMDPRQFTLIFCDGSLPRYKGDMGYGTLIGESGQEVRPAAAFFGEIKDNKYIIYLDSSQLHDPETLVATLAHEICYIKMTYIFKVPNTSDVVADLCPLFFGLGIFSANSPIRIYVHKESLGGYGTQEAVPKAMWGYILALYSCFRNEYKPEWVKYLIPEVRKYFKLSEKYISENKEQILGTYLEAK